LKIVQDERGIMYFGSLLTYDGVSWCLLKTANKTVVRSLCIPPGENRIYVGCFGEFGYFAPDGSGSLMFTSLMEHIPEENRKFQDV